MKELNNKEFSVIEPNLKAFNFNFEDELKILKCNKRFYIFKEEEMNDQYSNYIYHAEDINEVKGWLYGAVQAVNRMIKQK